LPTRWKKRAAPTPTSLTTSALLALMFAAVGRSMP
jgi:hypothetical protein